MTNLSQFELMIISKYFETIQDYINVSKTCKNYNIINNYEYNPLPIDIEQILIFENLNTIIVERPEYIYLDYFMNYNKPILKHLNHKLNIINKTYFNILNFKDYFNEIETKLSFEQWVRNGCKLDESKYVTKIKKGSINNYLMNTKQVKYIVLPKNINKISKYAIINCPELLFIIC